MLKILDKYIIRKYLTTFLFTMLIFSMIAMIIDFSDKVEDFIEEPCTIREIIVDYYFNFVIYINGMLTPLYALISVIFFTSRMAYDSEVISILNAGVSFRRIMLPYFLAASTVGGVHLFSNHYLIPKGNERRLSFENTYIWKYNDKGKTEDVHLFIGDQTKIFVNHYRKRDSVANDFRLEQFQENELVYLLKARRAEWEGQTKKWKLSDYEIRTFNGLKETFDAGKKMDTLINLYPKDFVRYQNQKEMMTTPELNRFITEEKRRGLGNTKVYEIEKHKRSSESFTLLILTLIGVSVASRKVRGGMGLHLAIGVAIGATYIFLSRFSTVFATNENLNPLFGVWLPNIVFSIVSIWLLFRAQK